MASISKVLPALAVFACLGLLAHPAMAQDAVSKAEQADGNLRPLEAKAIAEEGFKNTDAADPSQTATVQGDRH
jgi:hypothetical protein